MHLHTDDFWHNIVRGAIPPYLPESDEQNQTVVGVIAGAAFGYAAGGYTTIVDGIVGPWMLHHYSRAALRHPGIDVHLIILRPDRDTALARALARTEPGALTEEAPILALWDQFSDLGDYEANAIDTSRRTVPQTVDAVQEALREQKFRVTAAQD